MFIKKNYLSHAPMDSFFLTVIVVVFLISLFVYAVVQYPPLMIFALDLLVIGGFILIPFALGKLWRHEIHKVGELMKNIEEHKSAYHRLNKVQKEQFEQYSVLKSTEQSMNVLLEQPQNKLSEDQKEQLNFLQKQTRVNRLRLLGQWIKWSFYTINPFTQEPHPSLVENLMIIFSQKQFRAIRSFLIVWLLLSLVVIYFAFR